MGFGLHWVRALEEYGLRGQGVKVVVSWARVDCGLGVGGRDTG